MCASIPPLRGNDCRMRYRPDRSDLTLADMELPHAGIAGVVADHDGTQSRSKKGPDSTSHARTPRCSCGLTATATIILPGYLDILGR